MAKHKTTFPRPSSMRLLRNLSALSRPPTPSPALLVILAGLVGSINAVPVACLDSDGPPPFLCPSLHPRAEPDAQDFSLPSQTPPPSASVPGPSRVTRTDCPTSPAERNLRRDLAPGYTQGPDGRWRKLSTWSLYGSTICVCHDASSTVGTQPMDDLASTPTPSLPNETDLLPPGWSRSSEESAARTVLILSLSLILAALISVFIFFLLWRRRRNRELRKDPEKKPAKRKLPQQNVDSEKDHRAKSKLWTRASTRWRENIKQSARRRRNARLSNASLYGPNNSVVDLSHSISSTHSSPNSRSSSLPPSRPSSPTPTTSSTRSIRSLLTGTGHRPQNVHVEPPSPSPPSSPRPPAYQFGSHPSADVPSTKDPAQLSSGSSLHCSHLSYAESLPSDSPPPSPLQGDMTPSNFHIAHVATDDKAVLRQMEDLGSQPPTDPGSSDVHVSAPILYEDDVQPSEHEDAPKFISPSAAFPLPPTVVSSSKGKAAALEFYDNDDLSIEPDPQPSAPPFEAENSILPSAPSEGEVQPLPSAPPEIADSDDDPTADVGLPRETGDFSVDTSRPGPPRREPLPPRYRP